MNIPVRKILMVFAPLLGLLLFLSIVDPFQAPLVLLLIPYFLIFVFVYFLVRFISNIAKSELAQNTEVTKHHSVIGLTVASTLVLIVVLQSIRQLTIRDTLLAGGLVIVVILYLRRVG